MEIVRHPQLDRVRLAQFGKNLIELQPLPVGCLSNRVLNALAAFIEASPGNRL